MKIGEKHEYTIIYHDAITNTGGTNLEVTVTEGVFRCIFIKVTSGSEIDGKCVWVSEGINQSELVKKAIEWFERCRKVLELPEYSQERLSAMINSITDIWLIPFKDKAE